MNPAAGQSHLVGHLVMTAFILVGSRILFDLLAPRPMFWSSQEQFVTFLWHSLIGGPFILFALMVAAQRNQSGKKN